MCYGVGQCETARRRSVDGLRNVCRDVAGEAVGVAAAVPALVRRADQRVDVLEERDLLEQARADRRVLLDLVELLAREAAWLRQQLAAHADLADVVQQPRVADGAHLVGAEA